MGGDVVARMYSRLEPGKDFYLGTIPAGTMVTTEMLSLMAMYRATTGEPCDSEAMAMIIESCSDVSED